MRAALALLVAATALAAGCGGDDAGSPESVVRAWSTALNEGDDEAAARLFAEGATVVQGGFYATLPTRETAVAFNASLPCSGEIIALRVEDDQVIATFLLGDRPTSACDGPGERATALFVVAEGKIVLWQQVPTPGGAAPEDVPPAGDEAPAV